MNSKKYKTMKRQGLREFDIIRAGLKTPEAFERKVILEALGTLPLEKLREFAKVTVFDPREDLSILGKIREMPGTRENLAHFESVADLLSELGCLGNVQINVDVN